MKTGTLYIVATPIGNLGDMTFRAVEVLKSASRILCEDTRVSQHLLNHFGITVPTKTYHQHSVTSVIEDITSLLEHGETLALVTDAGTPGISDPGNQLISELLARRPDIPVVPVPGPSALTAALSISGFPCERFTFFGFPPHKNKRKKFFSELALVPHTIVFYESGYRILDAIKNLAEVVPEREICVCRELTKKFETIYRGTIQNIAASEISEKGEFVLVIR